MHTEYLQSLRYKLQKRIRRQKTTGFETYIFVLRQLLQFLDGEAPFVAVQAELMQRCPNADSVAEVQERIEDRPNVRPNTRRMRSDKNLKTPQDNHCMQWTTAAARIGTLSDYPQARQTF